MNLNLDMFKISRWDVACALCGIVTKHDNREDADMSCDEHDNTIGHDCVVVGIPVIADTPGTSIELKLLDGDPVNIVSVEGG